MTENPKTSESPTESDLNKFTKTTQSLIRIVRLVAVAIVIDLLLKGAVVYVVTQLNNNQHKSTRSTKELVVEVRDLDDTIRGIIASSQTSQPNPAVADALVKIGQIKEIVCAGQSIPECN